MDMARINKKFSCHTVELVKCHKQAGESQTIGTSYSQLKLIPNQEHADGVKIQIFLIFYFKVG